MVCSIGGRRMASLAKLLAIGNFSDVTTEEVKHENIVLQSIQKELNDADEENFLEEEDMHVFDCLPLMDPINLVQCNACKKPVKVSHYVAHSERCKSLCSSQVICLEADGNVGHNKKPTRKGRKKLQATHDLAIAFSDTERYESAYGMVESSVSLSKLDDQVEMSCALSQDECSSPLDCKITLVDGSGSCHQSMCVSSRMTSPEKKPVKVVEHVPLALANELGTQMGTLRNRSSHCLDIPAPLATKVYRLRNHHLRGALGNLYKATTIQVDQESDLQALKRIDRTVLTKIVEPLESWQEAQRKTLHKKE